MSAAETEGTQTEIQKKMTDPAAPQEMIDRAVQQHEEQSYEEGWDGHIRSALAGLSPCGSNKHGGLWIQMPGKEIHNRVITRNAVLVFEHVVTLVFEDQQIDILAFFL